MRRTHVDIAIQPYAQPAVPLPWPVAQEGPAREVLGTRPGPQRVLLGGIGYRNLRDMSAGPILIDRLRERAWPAGVVVEDLSYGAVHVLHWLQEQPPFDSAVLLAAVARGREPGTVTPAHWSAPETTAEVVQEAIAEAVTGVIGLDTLLTVLGYFAALPPRVMVIEIEPRDDDWGAEFSPVVETALSETVRLVEAQIRVLVQ